MIFKLSYSWLQEYIDTPKDARALALKISLHGASVDQVQRVKHEFTNVVVGQIKDIQPHLNADKLQLVIVDMGSGQIKRVVCGAPNIAVGQKVPLAIPGAVLPGGFVIKQRKVRGIESEGMLCSARELGLHDDHVGILILDASMRVGKLLTDSGNFEDYVLDIEPTTNRPDLNSVIGIAREVGAITGKKLKKIRTKPLSSKNKSALRVEVKDKKGCPRFSVVMVEGVKVGSSPWYVQERLARAGIRPINSIVDITNYVMLEFGQPMHAFDADKLGSKIIVRRAKKGENLKALDGQTYKLDPSHLVVANLKHPVSIAGIMGGEETGVTKNTTRVVFESANWESVGLRKTSRDLQLTSDSSRLFDKGLSTESVNLALARAVELANQFCGSRQVGAVVDVRSQAYKPRVINFPLSELERIIGIAVPRKMAIRLLKNLGFVVKESGGILKVEVPSWRDKDVLAPEDLVEEVARLYGYHNLSSVLPKAVFGHREGSLEFELEDDIKHSLKTLGFTEVYSYSLISETMLESLGEDKQKVLKLLNPLSSDLTYLRPSLIPSLVKVMESNIGHRDNFKLFEMAKVYKRGGKNNNYLDSYREETLRLGGVVSGIATSTENLYRYVKGIVEKLLAEAGVTDFEWKEAKKTLVFASGLSASFFVEGREQGAIGLLRPDFLSALGVQQEVAAFDLSESLLTSRMRRPRYRAIPKFPAVKRDLSLVLDISVRYTDLVNTMRQATALLQDIELFDIYKGEKLGRDKQGYALHLTYRSDNKTLTNTEVEKAENKIIKQLSKLGVKIRE